MRDRVPRLPVCAAPPGERAVYIAGAVVLLSAAAGLSDQPWAAIPAAIGGLLLAFSAITGRCVDSPISRRRRRSDEAGRESIPAAAPSTDHPREDVHED
jgi:peptidoglycan/LPS O-acetylase OafA/YrhL